MQARGRAAVRFCSCADSSFGGGQVKDIELPCAPGMSLGSKAGTAFAQNSGACTPENNNVESQLRASGYPEYAFSLWPKTINVGHRVTGSSSFPR